MKKLPKTDSIIALSVAAVTFVVFFPALRNGFINGDDTYYVYNNSFIRAFDARLFESAFGSFQAANWHPLTWLSHALDYAIWGLNPLGHHLTNNILHTLCTLLVVYLVMRLMEVYKEIADNRLCEPFLDGRTIGVTGAVTGLLFGLHPLHVESVAWVSERKDLLCALFFLLSIITYTGYASEISRKATGDPASHLSNKKYFFALGFFILALLSKPMATTLPFVLLILDWYPFERVHSLNTLWKAFCEKIPFIVLSLISSVLTILAQKEAIGLMQRVPLPIRVLVAIQSLISYLGKILWPVNLIPLYPYPDHISFFSLEYLVPIVLVTGITVACLAAVRKEKLWTSLWGYYVITLLPVLGIIQVGIQSMADRYTYLPSLGPFLIIGLASAKVYAGLTTLTRWKALLKITTLLIALALLVSLSYATIVQIGVWKDSFIFWNYVIEKEPGKVPLAFNNLGNAYMDKGLRDMAIAEFQTALRLNPDFAIAHNNLGLAYAAKGELDTAVTEYQTAVRLKPAYVDAHNNLGNAYAAKGELDMAVTEYQTAVRLNPDSIEAHNNLGVAYTSKGLLDMAISELQTALRLNPDSSETHNNLGLAYEAKDLLDMAISEFQTALRLNPAYAAAHRNLGLSYLDKGSIDMARREFEAVLTIQPDDYMARQFLNSLSSR